jgi:putative FmdB family regulatory protein
LPIYEYRCEACSFDFELKKAFGENSGAPCPRCGAEGRRRFSPVPIIFKGSGFYVTDSRSRNSATGSVNGSEGGDNEKAEAKEAGTKSEGSGSD